MIEISHLSVRFRRKIAIDDLRLYIAKGECVLLAGANGSGKTTLLRALAGVLRTGSGTIAIAGKQVSSKTRKKTAYIPASLSLYDGLKIKEAIRLHASFFPKFQYRHVADFPFDSRQKIGSLSKGEKTLFNLSLALATAPEYLLIDDVIHFLDPHLRDIFLRSILPLIEESQLTVIIATQSAFEMEGIPDRVVVLDKGRISLDETLDELKQKFVRIYAKEIPAGAPVVFQQQWGEMKEIYIYPYSPALPLTEQVAYLSLPQILRAFIGGGYDIR